VTGDLKAVETFAGTCSWPALSNILPLQEERFAECDGQVSAAGPVSVRRGEGDARLLRCGSMIRFSEEKSGIV
jgi:hypothetical protein